MSGFPEQRFPPAHDPEAYRHRVETGRILASQLHVAIGGLVRNLGNLLEPLRRRVERIGSQFATWHACFYENDSRDRSPKFLKQWAKTSSQIQVRCERLHKRHWNKTNDPKRVVDMASYRNSLRQMLLEIPHTDLIVVLDTDLKTGHSIDGILHSLSYWPNFDLMASNGLWYSHRKVLAAYDIYALRVDSWTRQRGIGFARQWAKQRGEPLVPVLSAFGGLAVYRPAAFAAAEYGGGDCEHVVLHRRMREAGFNAFFLNPSQLCVYDVLRS